MTVPSDNPPEKSSTPAWLRLVQILVPLAIAVVTAYVTLKPNSGESKNAQAAHEPPGDILPTVQCGFLPYHSGDSTVRLQIKAMRDSQIAAISKFPTIVSSEVRGAIRMQSGTRTAFDVGKEITYQGWVTDLRRERHGAKWKPINGTVTTNIGDVPFFLDEEPVPTVAPPPGQPDRRPMMTPAYRYLVQAKNVTPAVKGTSSPTGKK